MSSYNSCCGGETLKGFVDTEPLKNVIRLGARFLDFEVYSIYGKPIIAAGKDVSPNGKYCLKGTYNHLDFDEVMKKVKNWAFDKDFANNSKDLYF